MFHGLSLAFWILETNRMCGMSIFTYTNNNSLEGGNTMTPKMKKFHLRTGKRETFKNYEMEHPQWNDIPGTSVKVLIDENGKVLKYDTVEVIE